jgi:hypothetical protein
MLGPCPVRRCLTRDTFPSGCHPRILEEDAAPTVVKPSLGPNEKALTRSYKPRQTSSTYSSAYLPDQLGPSACDPGPGQEGSEVPLRELILLRTIYNVDRLV